MLNNINLQNKITDFFYVVTDHLFLHNFASWGHINRCPLGGSKVLYSFYLDYAEMFCQYKEH